MLAARTARGGQTRPYDVVVLGAGVAGLVTALDLLDGAPDLRVAVVDKGAVGTSGSTALAQGGLAAAVGPDDSPERHAADTMAAGDGLCDPHAVAVMTREGPARVTDLTNRGVRFDRDAQGRWALAREGGQSVPRSVRSADASGAAIFAALREAARGRVERLQGAACALAQHGPAGRVIGAWVVLDELDTNPSGPGQEAGLALLRAPAVVLATGGCGALYAATTNRGDATGDGVALAGTAGAELVDLEFVQFHPTGLRGSSHRRLLLTEALRGAGATLRDANGRRFLHQVHPDAELAPRHIVTKAILDQPGGAWLDATALPGDVLATEFPTVLAGARAHGYDLAVEPVPVEPCEHYMIGGVATDLFARSSVPGLWAAGEVACTGVHGANRMAGNSLLQSCVFAHRAAHSILRVVAGVDDPPLPRTGGLGEPDPDPPALGATAAPFGVASDLHGDRLSELREDLRAAMSAGAGPIRTAGSLDEAGKTLDTVAAALEDTAPGAGPQALQLRTMVTVGRLIVRSARLRTESRGVHWRDDAPTRHPDWAGVRLRVRSGHLI